MLRPYIREEICTKLTDALYFCSFGVLSQKYKLENDVTQVNSIQHTNSKMLIAKYNKSQQCIVVCCHYI